MPNRVRPEAVTAKVIVAAMPKLRAAMHLDTVFTFADRDCVLIYPDIVNSIDAFSYRPDGKGGVELHKDKGSFVETVRDSLGLKKMRVVETGGNDYMRERTQWDSGANLVCASPGVVFAYDRNTYANTLLRKGKTRRFRGIAGRTQDVKKAIVTLAEGQTIDVSTGL